MTNLIETTEQITITFKYQINQIVRAPLCSFEVVIKSIRYININEILDGKDTFKSVGQEYQLFYYLSDEESWREWGWVSQTELDTLND
jgi:hypothetical protein